MFVVLVLSILNRLAVISIQFSVFAPLKFQNDSYLYDVNFIGVFSVLLIFAFVFDCYVRLHSEFSLNIYILHTFSFIFFR